MQRHIPARSFGIALDLVSRLMDAAGLGGGGGEGKVVYVGGAPGEVYVGIGLARCFHYAE